MLISESITATIGWNPGPKDLLLIAGETADRTAIETVLRSLPSTSRGQVFIEVATVEDVGILDTPGRVVVCWLVRERGQSLRRSIDAWLSEMLPVDFSREHRVYSWVAADGVARALSSE